MTLTRSLDTAAAVEAEQKLQQRLLDTEEYTLDIEEDDGEDQAAEMAQKASSVSHVPPMTFFDNDALETVICGSPDSSFGPQQTINSPAPARAAVATGATDASVAGSATEGQPRLSNEASLTDTPTSITLPSPLTAGTVGAAAPAAAAAAASQAKLSPQRAAASPATSSIHAAPLAVTMTAAEADKAAAMPTLWSVWMNRRPKIPECVPGKVQPAQPLEGPEISAGIQEGAAVHSGRTRHIFREGASVSTDNGVLHPYSYCNSREAACISLVHGGRVAQCGQMW